MAYEIPTSEPARIRAGDTVTWRKTLDDYPATDGWVLYYRLFNATGSISITASADGATHLVSVAKAASANYTPGDYSWISWVDNGTERHSVSSGKVSILQDMSAVTSAGFDNRSTAKKTLELLDQAMLDYGSQAWSQEYEIAGRRRKFRSMAEFMSFRSQLQAEVRAEEAAERIQNGERPRNKLYVRL